MRSWILLGLLTAANILAYVDRTNLSIALASREFQQLFSLSSGDRGLLNSAFFWSYAFLQIPAGAVADRFGVKYPFAIGFLFWSLVSALTGMSGAVWHIFVCRLLLGAGEAILTPGALRWIRFHIPEERRGFAIGLFFAGAKAGPGVGAHLAALLMALYGWRWMFVLLGLGSLVWLVPWMAIARDDDRAIEAAAGGQVGSGSIAAALRSPALYGILVATFAYNYFNYYCLTWLPSYFVERWGMSLESSGAYTSFSFLGFAAVAILGGWAADRLIARGLDAERVRRWFTVAGLLLAATEIVGALSTSRDTALLMAMVSLAGLGLATGNYWALTQTLMPGAAIGRIAGVQNFASNLSGIAASMLTGWLVHATGQYLAPAVATCGILLSGALAYAVLVRRRFAPQGVRT